MGLTTALPRTPVTRMRREARIGTATNGARLGRAPVSVRPREGRPRPANGRGDDASLVAGLAGGDQRALAAVFEAHAPAVHGLARRICGVEHADDVVQEVFVRLWQHPERFEPGRGSLRSFLMANAHGRAVDLVRSNGARHRRERASSGPADLTSAAADDAALAGLRRDAMASVVRGLPRRERDAIALAYFAGRSYREVARLLGQPEGTIKTRIRSGLSRLRTELRP